MNLKICFILSVFCLGTLQAENLLQDLDVNTDLKFTTVKAFKYVKTINNEGQISITTKQASEANDLRMTIAKELQAEKTYKLYFTVMAKGQGQIDVGYGATGIASKKNKAQQLGLKRSFATKKEPQTYTCTFKVPKKNDAQAKGFFAFSLGAFQGDLILKDFKLVQIPNPREIHGKGVIAELKTPKLAPAQAKKSALTKAEKVKAARAAKFEQNKAARAAETAKRVEAAKRARAEQVAPAQVEKPTPAKAEQTEAIKPIKTLINI